jgi:hypothetical protein
METVRDLMAGTGSEYLVTLGIITALLAAVFAFAITGLRKAEAAG